MNFGGRFLAGSSVSKAATQYKGHIGPTPIAQRWHEMMIEDGLTNPSQGPYSELYQGIVPADAPNQTVWNDSQKCELRFRDRKC